MDNNGDSAAFPQVFELPMVRLADFPEDTFAAMRRIRETALVQFNSLFSPERKLWTLENLRRFHSLFVERFDAGEGSFLEKWKKQLEGADNDILQLAAELLYVQQFFTSITGPEKKLENVKAVLEWCSRPVTVPEWAVLGVGLGLAGDQSFNQHRPFHLAWLNEYLIHWQELPRSEQDALLYDPWRFAQDVRAVEFHRGAFQPMQEAWLYVAFPDSFENISSRRDKRRIRDAFYQNIPGGPTDNIDSDLLKIREELTSEHGVGFHFYRQPIAAMWKQSSLSEYDVELIRQSRTREKYSDFSPEEKLAYKRVHEALRQLGQVCVDELGGGRDYVLKLTSGFHPNSGIRGGKPKDLWFGIYRKENEKSFLGNPQLFMIVSGRGVEWGFSPLTHPDEFSNQEIKHAARAVAGTVLAQLPAASSTEASDLATELSTSGKWNFRRKQRLEAGQSEFETLQQWLLFLRSDEGAKNAGGGATRYAVGKEIDETDFFEAVREMARLFRPLMERVIADAPPATAAPNQIKLGPISLQSEPLPTFGKLLAAFLTELSAARQGPFQKTDSLWNAMSDLKGRLEQFPAVRSRPDQLVNISVGQGNWATVPWIALLNSKITRSTQEGIYVVFLITTDLDQIVLTLNQGTTNLVRELGQREAQKRMIDVAEKTRGLVANLATTGFSLDNKVDLGGGGWLAKNYEIGTVAHIDFKTTNIYLTTTR